MNSEQDRFVGAVLSNEINTAILDEVPALGLSDWWLTGGAVFQTVWNVIDGRDPRAGVTDYDLFYFDPDDLSPQAQTRVGERANELLSERGASVEVCNEARVHLWFEQHFGAPALPFTSSRDAIDQFASTTCCYALTRNAAGDIEVYAPHGYGDLFGQRVRPNPIIATREVYEAKTARWKLEWPKLAVEPWPLS